MPFPRGHQLLSALLFIQLLIHDTEALVAGRGKTGDSLEYPRQFTREYQYPCELAETNRPALLPPPPPRHRWSTRNLRGGMRCYSKELYDLDNRRVKVQEWSPDDPQWTMTTFLFTDSIYRYSVNPMMTYNNNNDDNNNQLQCAYYPESFGMPRMEQNRYLRTEFLSVGGVLTDIYQETNGSGVQWLVDSSTGRWLGSREPLGRGSNRTLLETLYDRFDAQIDPAEFQLPRHVECQPGRDERGFSKQ